MFGRLLDVPLGAAPSGPETTPPSPTDPVPPVAAAPDFQGVDFLVGGIWRAASEGGMRYEETVARTLNGWFLGSAAVTTSPSGEKTTHGMLGVDSSNQFLLMWGFRSDGAVIELKQVKTPEPSPPGSTSWVLEGTCLGLKARQTLTQTGPNQMNTVTELFVNGEWQATPALPYRRSAAGITTQACPVCGSQSTTGSRPGPARPRRGRRKPRR
ncbi:MAG TPA: hypothetical protein VN493_21950 [Thermoanaerobaculia bacterium]|nr:hypothetical protein [Thermoanaerobaculia bacterium]